MNFEDAAAELQTLGAMDVDGGIFGGRKVRPYDDHNEPPMDTFNPGPFQPPNFQNFPPPHNKQANKSGANANANFSPALIQKLLQQQQQQQQQQQSLQMLNLNNIQALANQKFGNGNNNAQLRHLMQQIQMAIQAGHLNAQILNQPMSAPTLSLLYQLLQQIKALGNLHQQMQLLCAKPNSAPSSSAQLIQLNVQVAQAKSRLSQLQSSICQQQAIFLNKQQVPQQQQHPQPPQSAGLQQQGGDGQLQTDFRDLSLKDFQQQQQNQSRLTQWKAPSFDSGGKEHDAGQVSTGDFSRAPGPSKASSGHNLLEQGNNSWPQSSQSESSVWSDVTSTADSSNGSSTGGENKDTAYSFSDLVPEFEPGKPWKGTQLKNVEDDPHITPGSIARSPLALGSLKESNLFWQPPPQKSDTWGYPPTSSGKSGKSSGWNSDFGTSSSELWSSGSKSRNAPPGWERQNNSTFLVLRNLTPQIDGSTLKTLCMQHGPLQMFHLFLSRGVALVRYSSCEEASKAQGALNNCVLSNTTMLADIPSEQEVQQYLQVASGQNSGNSWPTSPPAGSANNGNTGTANTGSSTFYNAGGSTGWNGNGNNSSAQLWSFSNPSLWVTGQPTKEHEPPTNPISFLPNDLLGGEPM